MPKKKTQPAATKQNEGTASWNELVMAYQLEEAIMAADAAFSARDYAEVVRLLSPFANVLDEMQAMKLEFCRQRNGSAGG